ncbi:Succinate--CoA ligase [ADP-forming] subunit alpha-1, mitochondrial [Vitis vinifera]|uniref:Succinate--CoA ligase [ADP-forming] subunit alpha-1, mitochondrial n=1 Tax=Vitis vinifera TaxID=29760 RepID=A0A438HM64_VITVI|nr:Succinate--CoA ligase [ADP-forming] subunit alpha-1, mitochondrial [Vitis vinifera]
MKQIVWHVTFWFYGGKGTAQDKIKTLREAGVTVVESPAKMGVAMLEAFKQKGLIPA